jgi:trk system potassium uptake protein TrkH
VPVRIVFQAMTLIAIMLTVHFVATALLAANQEWFDEDSVSFVAIMFEAMSALATVGLSTGITPSLETSSKLILCALMFLGRVGPLTVVFALQQRRRAVRLRFAAASVRIG